MKKPFFSVILPTYNRQTLLVRAIGGVLAQDFHDFELLIIDDGSTDQTKSILKKKYARWLKAGKIKFVSWASNRGVCAARNYGLSKAKGDWIAYLDSDNLWRPNFLATFVQEIKNQPQVKIFYAQYQLMSNSKIMCERFVPEKLLLENYIDLGVLVHQRGILSQGEKFDSRLSRLVDWDFILRITSNNTPVFIKKPLLLYNDSRKLKRISNQAELHAINYQMIMLKYWRNVTPAGFYQLYTTIFRSYFAPAEQMKYLQNLNKKLRANNQQLVTEQATFARSVWYKIWWHTRRFWRVHRADQIKKFCPFCQKELSFLHTGSPSRANAVCPVCAAFERHRFLYYVYQFHFLTETKKIRLLHCAPEKCLYELIKKNSNIEYHGADLFPENFDFVKVERQDLTALRYKAESFDVILSNHVAEHIEDEKKHWRNLQRVLKSNGKIFLCIPMNMDLAKTREGTHSDSAEERLKYYGQADHYRLYGRDVKSRLRNYGFEVRELESQIFPDTFIDHCQLVAEQESGTAMRDTYFILTKKDKIHQ